MTIYLPPFVALLGALMYGFAGNKLARLGEIMFFCGLLVTLMTMSSASFHVR